ncbi:MAG: MBL fold metallo-hydrolase [Candidatus Limnocylindrales bacterium]
MASPWVEIGDRVVVRRYEFFDQNIVAVLGDHETLVLDTRTTGAQAREILDDLRLLGAPPVGIVVNSHGHYDHVFGNSVFRPVSIWGHVRCASMIRETGERQRAGAAAELPEHAADLAMVVLDAPDHTFRERAVICLGEREVQLVYLGRGHTDNDIVLRIEDAGADVLCAGDLLENHATPYFTDGYPLDWPATVEALLAMTGPSTVVVPGHGDHEGRAFAERSLDEIRSVVDAARLVHAGSVTIDEAIPLVRYPPETAREPIKRALAQLRGELPG